MWIDVISEGDIEYLMDAYCGFHDSCIVSVSYASGAYVTRDGGMINGENSDHRLSLILNSQWGKPIELSFTGVRKFGIVGWEDNYFCDIYGAHIGFHTDLLGGGRDDRLIVWADDGNFSPSNYREYEIIARSGHNSSYVISEELKWRFLEYK